MSPGQQLQQTRIKLEEALERMRAGRTLRLSPGFKWTKASLAREAGVNVNTLLRKSPDGTFVYAEANLSLEQGPGGLPTGKSTKKQLRLRVAELEAKVLRLQRTIAEMSRNRS